MRSLVGAALACAFTCVATPAPAQVLIKISRARQTLSVVVDNVPVATWPVSTARRGYRTPVGSFRPQRLERVWYSHIYDHAPMPNAIFFAGGYAIHGTTEIRHLGRPASHGCIRLLPAHAKQLFNLVKRHGLRATRIVISRASTRRWGERTDWGEQLPRAAALIQRLRSSRGRKRERRRLYITAIRLPP